MTSHMLPKQALYQAELRPGSSTPGEKYGLCGVGASAGADARSLIPTFIDNAPFHGHEIGSFGQARREARCRCYRASAATHPAGRFGPPVRPGAFGRRRRRSSLEVAGTAAPLAPIRQTKIAAVKSVDI